MAKPHSRRFKIGNLLIKPKIKFEYKIFIFFKKNDVVHLNLGNIRILSTHLCIKLIPQISYFIYVCIVKLNTIIFN